MRALTFAAAGLSLMLGASAIWADTLPPDLATALLGGVATLKGADGGRPFTTRLRFMDVWARRGGAWKVIFTQATRVPAG
jgi:hypothetical protein